MSLVEDALSGPSVFKNESTLDFDYVPDELPHREDVLRRLAGLFRSVADGTMDQVVTIVGPVGTGKTALAKRFAADLREAMRKRGRRLVVAYVNCRNDRSDPMVLTTVLRTLDKGFPDRGFAIQEMLDALRKRIKKEEAQLLVVLDEVDVLVKNDGGLLYSFSRFKGEADDPMLSVIAVSQRDIFPLLDEATASTFKQANTVTLEGYDRGAMRDIVDQRVRLAFHPGTVPDDVAELIADVAASKRGNARLAVELLQASGTLANDRRDDHVTAEDVRTAKASKFADLPEHKLRELPLHEKLVLLGLARRLARSGNAFAITSEAEESYHLVCEEFEEKPRGHTQFWQYLNKLESYGFIQLKKSQAGQPGTTQYISLPDVPAGEFAETLGRLVQNSA